MLVAPVLAASRWISRVGVPTPAIDEFTPGAASDHAVPGPPWVLKPDAAVGGKGLLGLVKVAASRDQLDDQAAALSARMAELGVAGSLVVQEFVSGAESYLSWSLDERTGAAALRLSAAGGGGFDPSGAVTRHFSPSARPAAYDVRHAVSAAMPHLSGSSLQQVVTMALTLWELWHCAEATLVEINPLMIRDDGTIIAVGHNLEFDPQGSVGSLGFRPETIERDVFASDADRDAARELAAVGAVGDTKFVHLDGDVAMLVGGGGASLICIDRLAAHGLRPSCSIDTSPGMTGSAREALYRRGLSQSGLRGALIGAVAVSVVDSRVMAEALIRALSYLPEHPTFPIVARIAGPNEEQAAELIHAAGLPVHVFGRETTLEQACDVLASRLEAST